MNLLAKSAIGLLLAWNGAMTVGSAQDAYNDRDIEHCFAMRVGEKLDRHLGRTDVITVGVLMFGNVVGFPGLAVGGGIGLTGRVIKGMTTPSSPSGP
jgi:hypothetical protein